MSLKKRPKAIFISEQYSTVFPFNKSLQKDETPIPTLFHNTDGKATIYSSTYQLELITDMK